MKYGNSHYGFSNLTRVNTLCCLKVFICGLLLLLVTSVYSQSVSVRMVIAEETTGHAIPYAMVTIKDSTGLNTLAFQQADGEGEAIFQLESGRYYKISSSALGYEIKEEIAGPLREDSVVRFLLKEKENRLEEVIVRDTLPPITYRPDTVIYNARAFYTGRERKLKDLVDKLPGLDVDKDLNVTYKGEPVGTLLVEDRPFFGGDPELALRGLPADAISRIEVLEDYKPLGFTVDPFGRKQIALNVLIREEKRNVYFGEITGAVGSAKSHLLKADVFRFNRKVNNYLLGGANNVNKELLSFKSTIRLIGGGQRMLSDDFGAVSSLMAQISPPLNPSQASNSLVALGGNYTVSPTTQLNVFGLVPRNDFSDERQQVALTSSPGTIDLRESIFNQSRQHQNGQTLHTDWITKLPHNQTIKGYIGYANFVNRYERQQEYESTFLTRISELEAPGSKRKLGGYLEYALRAEAGHTFGMTVEMNHTVTDDNLSIASGGPASREDTTLALVLIGPEFMQTNRISQYTVNSKAEYVRILFPHLSLVTGLSARRRIYNRSLNSEVVSTEARPVFQQLQGRLGAATKTGPLVARLSVAYRIMDLRNNDVSENTGYILPNVSIETRLSPASTIEMNWQKQVDFADAAYFFQGYYVQDWFSYQVGNTGLSPQEVQSAELSYRYSNPIRYLNAGLRLSLARNEGPQVVSAFTLSGVNRSTQPVLVDLATNSWRGHVYAAFTRNGKKVKGDLYANVANQPVFTLAGPVVTSVARQWVTLKFETPIGNNTDFAVRLEGDRASFLTTRRTSVYGMGISFDVGYEYKRIIAEISGRMDAFDISGEMFVAGEIGIDLLYTFPDSPWALTLVGKTPVGPRRVRTFRQTDLSFEATTILIMRPYLLLGGALQF